MNSQITIVPPSDLTTAYGGDYAEFLKLADTVKRTLESVASQRVYDQTFRVWAEYCQSEGRSPLDFNPALVMDFLASKNTTRTTRQRQLSALRRLAQVAFVIEPNDTNHRYYEVLKIIKAPAPDKDAPIKERDKRYLTPAEADKLLRAWSGGTSKDIRNRALIAVLLLTGIRRSEVAALLWADVDFENGVLHIRHGKGNKSRDVPVAGELALDALRAWQMHQPIGYKCIFTPIERGDKVGKDKAISGTDVYRTVKDTEKLARVMFRPHDCRRTFITEALATGTQIKTVQTIAGHSRGDTTLAYAEKVDARRARKELKLRYG